MTKLRFFLCFTCFFFCLKPSAERKTIMVLHSYHMGLEWTDNVTSGIVETFEPTKDSVEIFYEYLDGKRNLSQLYYEQLKQLYKIKLKDISVDLLITSDNNALEFALNNRQKFFNNIPIVFCGVNNYNDSLIYGHKNVTGIVEEPDFKATINLIKKNHPYVTRLCIINDNKTTTGIENKKLLKPIEQDFNELLKFDYWEDYTIDEISYKLGELKPADAVLLLTFNKDKNGTYISYKRSHELLPINISQPVYAPWQFFMKPPVVGGKIVYGKNQGSRAANIAIKILQGTQADSIPINKTSLSQYTFIYDMLGKFNININDLPIDSIILNKPQYFYVKHKLTIMWTTILSFVASIIIIVLLRNIIQRKKAEKSIIEKQLGLEKRWQFQKLNSYIVSLLNSTNDFTSVTDEILQILTKNYHFSKVTLLSLDSNSEVDKIISSRTTSIEENLSQFIKNEIPKVNRLIEIVKTNNIFSANNLDNLTEEEVSFYNNINVKAISFFPIRMGERIFGIAAFAYGHEHIWNNEQIEELSTLVGLIANAWERNIQMNKFLLAEKRNMKSNLMLEKSSRLASIGVMASGITHEINQPLNALRVTVDNLRFWERKNKELVPEIVSNKLNTLSMGVHRIDAIIKHMRKFWIISPETELKNKVSLSKTVSNVYTLIEWQLNESNIEIDIVLPDQELLVNASSIQIEQIIINLVTNSIQALNKCNHLHKKIKIEVISNENQCTVIISDNATGIPIGIGEQIYDPFYSTKHSEDGSGLGLAIVKAIVDSIKGKVWYQNNPLGGVSFYISLDRIKKYKNSENISC